MNDTDHWELTTDHGPLTAGRIMNQYKPERIYVERCVREAAITRHVLERLQGVPVKEIDSTESLLEESKRANPATARAKKQLILARHKGHFFKPCPGSRSREGIQNACCNYFVVNYASNCHLECSYCYLQAYLNFPYLIVYANVEDLLWELEAAFRAAPGEFFRIGTGELADSLALDPLTGYSIPLVEFFACQENAVLELKTKSHCIENLLSLHHRGRTVVSWSMSPRFVQQQEEHKTATIDERLAAAERCVTVGYPVAFHFDPLIHYPQWEDDYRHLVAEILDRVPASSISWISLGALRLTSALKETMRERFPRSFLPLGELLPCPDGKLRYFKPLRVEMFQKMLGWIRDRTSGTPVYTCMESEEVWAKVFGALPPPQREVGQYLASGMKLQVLNSAG